MGRGALGTTMFGYSTTDGEAWEAAQLFGPDSFHSMDGIAGGPPTLVGVGSHHSPDVSNPQNFTRIYTSSDWRTWEPLVDGPPGRLTSVAYDNQNARFVAGGMHADPAVEFQAFPVVWLSEDGDAWRPVVIDPEHGIVADVAIANGIIVAAGTRGWSDDVVVWESADGVTWSATDLGATGVPRLVAHEGEVLLLATTWTEVEETLVWTTTVSP